VICIDGVIAEIWGLVDRFVTDECECNTHTIRRDQGLTEMDVLVRAFVRWLGPDRIDAVVLDEQPRVVLSKILAVSIAEQRLLYHASRMRTRMVDVGDGRWVKKHVVDVVLRHPLKEVVAQDPSPQPSTRRGEGAGEEVGAVLPSSGERSHDEGKLGGGTPHLRVLGGGEKESGEAEVAASRGCG